MTCASCRRSIESAFTFCPYCGVRREGAQPATASLDAVLGRWQLHLGHDYRRRDQDAAGATTAVYMLGVSETVVEAMRTLLPDHEFVERERRPGAGDSADWLRVDVVPRAGRDDQKRAPNKQLAPRLHLTDIESRQAATGQVLIARPVDITPVGSFVTHDDGAVSWTEVSDIDRICVPAPKWRRAAPPWGPGAAVLGREAWAIRPDARGVTCSDGETIYRADDRHGSRRWTSSATMPDKRVRHKLRAVRAEFREIASIREREAALAGFRSNGIEAARYHFRNAWEERYGTPWGGWAWLTWFEAVALGEPGRP